jgi:DNA-binding response OmpR family regulator
MEEEAVTQIVLIDGNIRYANSLQQQLEIEGYQVGVAYDAPTGVALINRLAPDLVVLDIDLGPQDGYFILRGLGEKERRIPCIVLTAHTEDWAKMRAFEFGADDYITKPVGIQLLLARLLTILRRVNANRPAGAYRGESV